MNLLEHNGKSLEYISRCIEKEISLLEFYRARGEIDSEGLENLEYLLAFRLELYTAMTIVKDREYQAN